MPRKTNSIKAFCAELNSVIHVKRLTERQFKIILNKLIRLVKSTKSGEFDFVKYVKIIVTNALTNDERKTFVTRMEEAQQVKETVKDPLLEYKLLGAYYNTVTEYYPELRIEFVCYEINEVLPDSVLLENLIKDSKEDADFKKKLEQKTSRSF